MIGTSLLTIFFRTDAAWVLLVALQFGLAIVVLAHATHGGQINCAVTLTLCVSGALPWAQGALNFIAQMLGSVTGALLLRATMGRKNKDGRDSTGTLGSNSVSEDFSARNALVAEFVLTALLLHVVMQTCVNARSTAGTAAPLAVGLAVFLAHVVLIPIDGCSINPTRSFGPALVSNTFDDHYVFWVAPLAAAGVVGLAYRLLGIAKTPEPPTESNRKAPEMRLGSSF